MENMRVLLVDDDIDLGGLISMGLTSMGYEVHFQNSLVGMQGIIEHFAPGIIVLDVEIGRQNGIDEASNILQTFPDIPIIFISSHTEMDYINKGLTTGGVTYLKKPFDVQELEAYIRRFAVEKKDFPVAIGLYSLNLGNHQLTYKEEVVKQLSPLEKNCLLLLIKNQDTTVSRALLAKELWGNELSADIEASLNNVISKLRKMLAKDSHIKLSTIRNEGYRLEYY